MRRWPALPSVRVLINSRPQRALVDTGCSQSIVSAKLVRGQGKRNVATVDGRTVHGIGEANVELTVDGRRLVMKCLVMPNLVDGFGVILGMDVIKWFGRVCVGGNGVRFGGLEAVAAAAALPVDEKPAPVEISDKDFEAKFDGSKWIVGWKWRGRAPVLTNKVSTYSMSAEVKRRFDIEMDRWKAEGWLQPCGAPVHGVIPLLAVEQEQKGKVRPVMDFRELNGHVESYTGDSDACSETTRKWRAMKGQLAMLDLRSAYLQLHVREDLQQFQMVQHKGEFFRLTRLGFGLNCAPKIMTAVLAKVLSLDPVIDAATDHYIDDIVVNCSLVSPERVVEHLRRYGLQTKPLECFEDTCVLGLQLRSVPGQGLMWSRSNEIPNVDELQQLTRRELFSICGKLIGHYPVAGWLRVACSFIKRHSEGAALEDEIGDKARGWLREIIQRLRSDDPVCGVWRAAVDEECRIWCDASSLALGVVVEMGGKVVEDSSWLRKREDGAHINIAELDAVIKGVNLALKWQLKEMTLMTDSATVHGWLHSLLTGSHRAKVSGIAEMLVRRRLSMIKELCKEYDLNVAVELVRSEANKADAVTRVPKTWLRREQPRTSVKELHARHHFGVRRSLYFARQVDPAVTRADVEAVIRACPHCASVDPAPTRWDKGELRVKENWQRIAADVTHFGQDRFLTMVDCGPSRFAIWRKLSSENASTVAAVFEQVFRERGPPTELLLDNSATFRSEVLTDLCKCWAVRRSFRCAYRPSGNGIVERNHRTIKSLAARSGKSPLDVLFWYNCAPLDDGTVPAAALHTYRWRNPDVLHDVDGWCEDGNRYRVGDAVFVKPAQGRCTTRWSTGIVTAAPSTQLVEVDGMPRHVADCRPAPVEHREEEQPEEQEEENVPVRRSSRAKQPPWRFPDTDPAVLL